MIVDCFYDPDRDISEVDPFGSVDLAKMHATGSVPASVPVTEERFNGIENPNSIAGRVSDDFDAMQANKAILAYKPKSKGSDDGSNE